MTLPHGFGRRYDDRPSVAQAHNCKLGQECSKNCGSEKCYLHQWTYRHDEAWMGIKILLVSIIAITVLVIAVLSIEDYSYSLGEPVRIIIEGYNCNDLAEYIADKKPQYDYAEHRYGWLCVNEQIKEFQ